MLPLLDLSSEILSTTSLELRFCFTAMPLLKLWQTDMTTPTLCVHFSPSDNYITGFDFDIYFSQVKVGLVKGKFEVVEEIRKPGHPPVLQQVHRP